MVMKKFRKGEFVSIILPSNISNIFKITRVYSNDTYDIEKIGYNITTREVNLKLSKINEEETIKYNRNLKLEQLGL